jgi:hypothetical protein
MPILALLFSAAMAAQAAIMPLPTAAHVVVVAPHKYIDPLRASLEKTPLGELELGAVLRDAHVAVFGVEPTMRRLSVAWGQVTLEGAKRGFNHNLGSIGLPDSNTTSPYVMVAGARFATAPTFIDGAIRYWQTLKGNFPNTLKMFDSGDAYSCGMAMGRGGYHRSDSEDYAMKMRNLAGTFWRVVAPKL